MSRPPYGRTVLGNDWTQLDGETPEAHRTVSVVVVHHEQEQELARTLRGLARQDYPADRLEIIVVDDGSTRAPIPPAGVRLVRQPRAGARRAAARNRGVEASHGELLCFLDADTVPEPGYLRRLCRLPSLAPEAVTVGRRRHADLSAAAPEAPVAAAGPAHELPSPRWLADGYRASGDLRHSGPRSFRFVISATLATSRWFFDEVGGFDESFRAYGGEDWEWAYRAWCGGAIFAHVPDAVAWHDGPDWAGRRSADPDGEARREKNREAVHLASRIPVAGHRTRGLLTRRAEAVIGVAPHLSAAAAFVSVDSVLAALPHAGVVVAQPERTDWAGDPRVFGELAIDHPYLAWPALHVEIQAGVAVEPAAFEAECEAFLDRDAGSWQIRDGDGPLLRLDGARQRRRRDRWGAGAVPTTESRELACVRRLTEPPDVEAYLGGWRRPQPML